MAASMYPGRRPDIVMQGMTDPHQDPGAMFNNILQLQQYSQQQGAFNRAAPDIAKQLNMTVDEVMARGPAGVQTLLDAQRQAQAPTDAMKNAEAATKAWASANPGATPAEIEEYKGNMLAQTVSNMDPATRAWSNAVRIWRSDPANKDQPLPPGMKDPLTYAGTVAEHAKTIEHAADEKASAITSFPTISASWDHTVKMIDWLTDPAHIDAVRTAIQTPGGGAALNPLASQDEKDARGYLDTLGNQQFRSGMQDVKNIRSQQEANKVGGSMSSLDRMGNSNKAIDEELARLKDIAYRGFATVTAAAGRQVPAKFKGKADQTYLDRNSPYYNGATEEEPPAEGGGGQASGGQASGALKPMPDATKKAAQARIAQEPGVRAELMDHLRQQGFDPTGL
jgi:hypothetical protein